jgi:uncharacterized protein
MSVLAVLGGVALSLVLWYFLFVRRRERLWTATWLVAGALIAYSVAVLAALGELGDTIGPVGAAELAAGVAVGTAWLAATHVGHAVLARIFPGFVDQVRDLYRLGEDEAPSRVAGPVVAMAVGEELLFRGVVQGLTGFAVGVVVYAGVQAVERKWALVLAAVISGVIWGGLFELTGGLAAPVVAHVIWTLGLVLVWPLGHREPEPSSATSTR